MGLHCNIFLKFGVVEPRCMPEIKHKSTIPFLGGQTAWMQAEDRDLTEAGTQALL